jgi:hypothetical protein
LAISCRAAGPWFVCLAALSLSACNQPTVVLEVRNLIDTDVTATFVARDTIGTVGPVSPDGDVWARHDLIETGSDGTYGVHLVLADGRRASYSFGYFTGRYPDADTIRVTLESDTTWFGWNTVLLEASEGWGVHTGRGELVPFDTSKTSVPTRASVR